MKYGRGTPAGYDGATSGTCTKSYSYPGCLAEVEIGVHLKGHDIADGMHAALVPGECCTLCQQRPECVFYTYIFGQCYLKSSDAGRTIDGNGISGYVPPSARVPPAPAPAPPANTAGQEFDVSLESLVNGPEAETVIRIKGLSLGQTIAAAGGTLLFIIIMAVTVPVLYVKRKYGTEMFRPPAESIEGFEEELALSEDNSWAGTSMSTSRFTAKVAGAGADSMAPPSARLEGLPGMKQWWERGVSQVTGNDDASARKALHMVGLDLGGESNDVDDALYEEPLGLYNKSPSIAAMSAESSSPPPSAAVSMPVFKPPFAITSFDQQANSNNYFEKVERRVSKLTTSITGSSAASNESDFEI